MSLFADFVPIMILIIVIAFVFELMDASLGIGFGTAVTPILLIIGYEPFEVVPSVLMAELFAGAIAMIFHALLKNVKLGQKRVFRRRRKRSKKVHTIPRNQIGLLSNKPQSYPPNKSHSINYDKIEIEELNKSEDLESDIEEEEEIIVVDEEDLTVDEEDEIEEIKLDNKSFLKRINNLTTDTKIIIVLSIIGILAAVIAAVLNVVFDYNDYFNFAVKIYISVMVFAMGVLILALRNEKIKFSMRRIVGIGGLAGFNKGLSGGGYRPVTVIGQMLSGREGRSALASTTYSKTVVSFVGLLAYILTHVIENIRDNIPIDFQYLEIAPYLVIGAIVAAPIGAIITKEVKAKWLKIAIGSGTIVLGLFSLLRLSLLELGIWQKIGRLVEIIN
jgi:uncharacterized membrane protein YfcA